MRISAKGKRSVTLKLSFWWSETDNAIHLTTNDPAVKTFHVAVRKDKSKPSGHPYLFRELAKCLRQMDAPGPQAEK
jgi:hypothetical protein